MLNPEQIAALRDAAGQLCDPINDYLIADVARRVSEAGQLTSTASYEVWKLQNLGVSQRELKKRLRELLGASHRDIRRLLTQSAAVGYDFDVKHLPQVQAIPFARNAALQQIVSAAVQLAQDDFTNITQTIGMVDPFGNALPLQSAYRACTDFAFQQVATGAADYTTAIRQACKNLADQGVQVINYENGVHTSLEAAVRRNIMGGMGLMQEQITQRNHDDLGCDGWEISAHANSAPDHEPIQGKQYGDKEYEALNHSLVRRIGTLNCGHAAFPIILGVNSPQYTAEELKQFRTDNEKGVTYQGRHYTGYEATQLQRKIERAARRQKRRILTDEATGDKEKLTVDQIKLRRLNEEYKRFSKAAGLRTQNERAQVAGFGRGQAARASKAGVEKQKQPAILDENDVSAINTYKSARSYQINAALRGDAPMTQEIRNVVADIDRAIEKLPAYEGEIRRSLSSDMIADLDGFYKKYTHGATIEELAFTSASTETYDPKMDIQMVISSKNGRDMRAYNPLEQEVLFRRGTKFRVVRKDGDTIYLEEEL